MGVLKQWLPYVLSGISAGGQYALIAVGYTMVYGILRLINFAHGDIFMVAGLIMVYLSATMPLYAALPAVVILTVALGFAVERCAYKPLRQAPRMSVMISAIGVSYLLQNLAYYVTGGVPKQYPELPWISDTITILGASTKRVTVITPVLTLVLVVALVVLIKRTKVGMAMRAASKDFETAQLMGIKINSVISFTFIIGSALAAVASFLFFSNYTTIAPSSGAMPGPQGVRRRRLRRYRVDPRCGHRRVHHRHLRESAQRHEADGVLRCVYICAAHRHPRCQADGPVR